MRPLILLPILFTFLVGCKDRQTNTLGQAPSASPQPIASVKTAADAAPATVEGVMVEKCPVAGCWFIMRDQTGTIKVDTKMAGFVVVDVPLKTKLVVAGQIRSDGTDKLIQATGVRY
jgi:uncharacterized protein YdeI (BOF family)